MLKCFFAVSFAIPVCAIEISPMTKYTARNIVYTDLSNLIVRYHHAKSFHCFHMKYCKCSSCAIRACDDLSIQMIMV